MRKIMMIGKIGCGKTTLSQRLLNMEVKYQKTQAIEVVGDDIMDTPGEYLEQKQFYSALLVTAADADVIVLLAAANDEMNAFSPRMSSMFCGKPVIGVITKTDIEDSEERLSEIAELLTMAGADRIIKVGFQNNDCIDELREIIELAGSEDI